MCEAHAFILNDGKEEKLMENVDELEVEGDTIRMVNIFGERKIVKAKVRSYHNRESKILLESI